ncbi:MAG: glycoside hydrolase [Candidatus Omnitrophica bacterium]|nr:glycoside hydrolase [Candidatus Omnitrophota bacterium]
MKRLDVAFIWHMHQPYYKDVITGKYLMPWVRLHGVKDYFPMAALVEKFENVKATFNMVPVLAEQLNDYVQNDASDILLDLTIKKASDLTLDEKFQVLNNFFRVNFKRFIEPNARYSQLLIKRGMNVSAPALKKIIKNFSDGDLLDLQVLFKLSWFHSFGIDEDFNLKSLVEKKESYMEEDKEYVIFKQKQILSQILPLYRRLQDTGRIEITTTPYYHPILPLLCDTSIARRSSPAMRLPKQRFAHPEDAELQIEEAIKYHTEQFGRPPRGMWPSEGSVSEEALDIVISKGIDWIAADEDILFRSLLSSDRRVTYQPYRLKRDSRTLNIVFRDKNLSDMISFTYNSWDQVKAAEDLLGHFRRILENLRRDADRGLATIVMDGENAWEYYEDNGRTFFERLYSNLDGKESSINSTTVSEYLTAEPHRKTITNIFPGSWINHNFEIWIGEEQDNLSWEYLVRTRRDLERYTKEADKHSGVDMSNIRKAWRELYIAEGSDWNWWYSGKAKAGKDNPFDRLYRMHLKNVYRFLKRPVPDFLKISIA